MVRGWKWFRCYDCENVFWGIDIEYAMTVFSKPMQCDKCGSCRTLSH